MPNVPGDRWGDLRAELDIDQGTSAEALGINKRTLQNIETNPLQSVSLTVIYRAARLYGVSAAWLRGDRSEDGTPAAPPEEPAKPPVREERDPDPSAPPPRPDRGRKGPPRTDLAEAS